MNNPTKKSSWKHKLHEIIYEADTPEGKLFDVILLIAIIASIILVMLESVESIDNKYHDALYVGEWIITILFSIEYILRVISIRKPTRYIFSFYGIIDFLSTIPIYISFFFAGSQGLVALRASKAKIAVFLFFVLIVCIILGTVMYMIEGAENGFTNIPKSIYWAIVTLTTVGFGDIAPQTPLGQLIASVIMILGYSIIAIPTGIVSAEMNKTTPDHDHNTQSCPNCLKSNHKEKATFCYNCGSILNP